MFYALAITLCLAVLFLALAGSSILFLPAMLLARRLARTVAPENGANMLFLTRLLPLLLTAVVTLGLALPAFLEFEPYSTREGIGFRLDALAVAGALLLVCMAARGWRILRATNEAQQSWRKNSERVCLEGIDLPVYRVKNGSSLLAVTGIFRAKVFLSGDIAETLSPQELSAALQHEMAHVAAFDNLKQMLLKMTQPPRWLKAYHHADAEWSGASEIAADRSALASGASVLDLSSALIKVGRLSRGSGAANAIASHLIPTACSSSLEQRIVRLSELIQSNEETAVHKAQRGKLFVAVIFSAAAYVACIHALLPAVHEALELLVR